MSNRLINTTFTGKDISAGTVIVYTYTATKAATIRFRIGLDAVAGGGDYVFWLTLQRGGAGTTYTVLPKTTGTAAAAETALMVMTIPIDVVTSDVVNVYVDGLAGDTNESGTVEVFEDDYLRPTTAAQYTVDVTAGGEVGIDWANIGTPGSTVGLSGTTVKAVTDGVPLANDAITSAKFDESTAFPLKSADTGATQVARVGADGDTLETLSDEIAVAQVDLDNPSQYKADVSALALQASVDDLEGRLTATRAGYLDNLSGGAAALEATLTAVKGAGWTDETLKALGDLLDAILLDTGTDGVALSTAVKQAIADEVLKRGVSNVEDVADAHSLATIILASLESSISEAVWTIKKTDGTTFTTKTVTLDSGAAPITAVT